MYSYACIFHLTISDPLDEENYVFDMYLLQHLCSPKVEPTKMSVNNLTHERLVCELAAMERRLEDYMKEQLEKVWYMYIHLFYLNLYSYCMAK